jgi:DNA mismatch endonuclease (patch repair protein)
VADVFTKKKRSQIMSRIRGKNTSPEKALFAILKKLGLKPKRHQTDLPGSPDLVLLRPKVAIFTNGCFWHGHKNCPRSKLPTTNLLFWKKKITTNIRRDQRQRILLRKMKWKVLTFWTCTPLTAASVTSRLKTVGLAPWKGNGLGP